MGGNVKAVKVGRDLLFAEKITDYKGFIQVQEVKNIRAISYKPCNLWPHFTAVMKRLCQVLYGFTAYISNFTSGNSSGT